MVETWALCSLACVTNGRALRRGSGGRSRHPLGHLSFKPRRMTSGGPTPALPQTGPRAQAPLISWPSPENKMLGSTLEPKSTAAFFLTLLRLQFNPLELSCPLSGARAGFAFQHRRESSWIFKFVTYFFAKLGMGKKQVRGKRCKR